MWEHPPSGTARGGRDESADRRHPLSRVNSQVTEYPELLPFFWNFSVKRAFDASASRLEQCGPKIHTTICKKGLRAGFKFQKQLNSLELGMLASFST